MRPVAYPCQDDRALAGGSRVWSGTASPARRLCAS